MNQLQFDADLNGSDCEEFREFQGNPIRQLFDNPPRGMSEPSYLDKDENMSSPMTINERRERTYKWRAGA